MILPLLALPHTVLTPMLPQPVKIDKAEQREMLEVCFGSGAQIFIGTSETSVDNKDEKILDVGLVCIVDRVFQMPGNPTLIFLRPLFRANFENMVYNPEYPMARVTPLKSIEAPKRLTKEVKLTLERIENLSNGILNYIPEPEHENALKLIKENSQDLIRKLYAIVHVAPLSWEEKYKIVSLDNFKELLNTIAISLDEAEQRIAIQAAIHEKTHIEISRQQKENFLRIHLKQIKDELGESNEFDDADELLVKAEKKNWNEETKAHFEKELKKLRRLNVNNPEYSIQYSYLETFLDLPWEKYENKEFSLDDVQKILDRDHYGLEKVKERILEYIAVIKLRNDLKAPILCLYGPPGVGKTSIGKSIAEAVGREYVRVALGGMHDEAEIRGHRRTYIGSMPGRILHSLSKCRYGNPLFLLDEIDKVGKDFKGDPASALLEALDPEQNNTFHDNFIDFPYDLSKVMFIATANDISKIPPALRDRMEIIEMVRYSVEEKKQIALRHLVNKALEESGFKIGDFTFTEEAIEYIIKAHTQEAGVRQLAKRLGSVVRKLALKKVRGQKIPDQINKDDVVNLIGKKSTSASNLGFRTL